MLKILQARLQQYVNHELPDDQAGFRKVRGTRDKTVNICWIAEKAGEFQKNIYFCFTDYAKAFDCVDHNKLWKILRDRNTRPPVLPPEKTAQKQQNCTRSNRLAQNWERSTRLNAVPRLFNSHAEYIMQNISWVKHSWSPDARSIHSLRHADDTATMAERKGN